MDHNQVAFGANFVNNLIVENKVDVSKVSKDVKKVSVTLRFLKLIFLK